MSITCSKSKRLFPNRSKRLAATAGENGLDMAIMGIMVTITDVMDIIQEIIMENLSPKANKDIVEKAHIGS